MNATNNHNTELVSAINDIQRTPFFANALAIAAYTLAQANAEEVYEKVLNSQEDEEGLLDRMTPVEFYETAGDTFLSQVCDDNDLNAIVKACGWYKEHKHPNKFFRLTYKRGAVCGTIYYGVNEKTPTIPSEIQAIIASAEKHLTIEVSMEDYVEEISRYGA